MSRSSDSFRRRPSHHRDRGTAGGKASSGQKGGGRQNSRPQDTDNTILVEQQQIDLRNRSLAALLAWAIPGLGHAYQQRYRKAGTFFVAIMSLWIFGFAVGGEHVVYASWQPGDKRWHFAFQAGAGAVAIPAIIQGRKMNQYTDRQTGGTRPDYRPVRWLGDLMAPPFRPVRDEAADQVAAWYSTKGAGYEMGTWYTVIAGLLNILVIYDAYGGPLSTSISGRRAVGSEDQDSDDEAGEDDPDDNGAGKIEAGKNEAGKNEAGKTEANPDSSDSTDSKDKPKEIQA
ncbi:MAG: DUF6677 family protein [Planctomycetota bacterium]